MRVGTLSPSPAKGVSIKPRYGVRGGGMDKSVQPRLHGMRKNPKEQTMKP